MILPIEKTRAVSTMHELRFSLRILSIASLSWLVLAVSTSRANEGHPPRRLLFFHRSAGFQHSVVEVKDGKPCYAETILRPICDKHHWELVSTKDGDVFTPENIDTFDAFLFYTTDDLTAPHATDGSKPMSKEGKTAFLEAIRNGKGYVGFHCAADTFHSQGDRGETQSVDERDPYIDMLGGEFIVHGSQQSTTMTVVDQKFPGAASLGPNFVMHEEWYSLKNFADDLHVLLVNETKDMHDKCYERPPFPASWIRNYGTGRVFYTSMGHREDVWTSSQFQSLVIGGISWAVGDAKANTTPNIKSATPKANVLPPK
ncbi:MAG: ThuA domain-containing protein [Pirellulales bacterium]